MTFGVAPLFGVIALFGEVSAVLAADTACTGWKD